MSDSCEYCGRPISLTKVGNRYRWLTKAKRDSWLCGKDDYKIWRHSPTAATDEPHYGSYDGLPGRYVVGGWIFVGGSWNWVADYSMTARPMHKADYEYLHADKNLPPLPSEAFKSTRHIKIEEA